MTPDAAARAGLGACLAPVVVHGTAVGAEQPALFQVRTTTTVRAAESSRESRCTRCGRSDRLRLNPLLIEAVPEGDWAVASLSDNPPVLIFSPKTRDALGAIEAELEFEPVYVQGNFEPVACDWVDIATSEGACPPRAMTARRAA